MIVGESVTPLPSGTGDSKETPGRDAGASEPEPGIARADLVLVQRCAWTLVWVAVLAAALNFWGAWSAGMWAALLGPALVLTALVGAVLVWTVPRPLSA